MSLQNIQKNGNAVWYGDTHAWDTWLSSIPAYSVVKANGKRELFDVQKIISCVTRVAQGVSDEIFLGLVVQEVVKNLFDGISTTAIADLLVLTASSFIERDPSYNTVAVRLLSQKLYKEVIGVSVSPEALKDMYRTTFIQGIMRGIDAGVLDTRLASFDLQRLSHSLVIERDSLFTFLGLQTLPERYLLKVQGKRIELPQSFWMRIAMGLAICEDDITSRAIEFYQVLSTMRFVSSTPTLLHAGLTRAQLSSCYLTTINDDLSHIFKSLGDIAFLSKWSGGVASDWTNLRATGANIKSINVESQGVIPFLKLAFFASGVG